MCMCLINCVIIVQMMNDKNIHGIHVLYQACSGPIRKTNGDTTRTTLNQAKLVAIDTLSRGYGVHPLPMQEVSYVCKVIYSHYWTYIA